jgi:hypothetical protein
MRYLTNSELPGEFTLLSAIVSHPELHFINTELN